MPTLLPLPLNPYSKDKMATHPIRPATLLVIALASGWAWSASLAQEALTPAPPSETVVVAESENLESSPESSPESPLATLDWLVGSWFGETENGTIEFSCHFTKNNAFMVRSFRVLQGEEVSLSGMQVIAWDPAEQTIRSWTYDSAGGFGEDIWSQADDHYTLRAKYTLSDGGKGSALHVMKYIDDDSFGWTSTNREIDGELQPDTPQVVLTRVVADDPDTTTSTIDGESEQ